MTSDTEPSDSNCTWCVFEYESVKASQQAPLQSTKYRLKPAYFQGHLGKNYVWFLFAMPNADGPANVMPKRKTTDILNALKSIKILCCYLDRYLINCPYMLIAYFFILWCNEKISNCLTTFSYKPLSIQR